MKAIKEFLKLLDKNSFQKISYDTKQYECEIARILELIQDDKQGYIEYCTSFYKKCIDTNSFALKHPLHNDITCYGVYSFCAGWCNYIFMIDEDNHFPFLVIQLHHIMNLVVLPQGYIDFPFNPIALLPYIPFLMSHLKTISQDLLAYHGTNLAFDLWQARPYHCCSEVMHGIYEVYSKSQKALKIASKSFFIPKNLCEKVSYENQVLIRPTIDSVYSHKDLHDEKLSFHIREFKQECLQDFTKLVAFKDIDKNICKINLQEFALDELDRIKELETADRGGGFTNV